MEPAPLYLDVAEAPDGGRAYFVKTKDGTRVRFALWGGGGRGLAVVLPGRTECIEKYGRVTQKLVDRGLSVVVIDFRGQGLSDRPNHSTAVGHVDDFSEYQLDVAAVLAHPQVAAIQAPRLMFSHSMGGCIGLRTLLSEHSFAAAVFSAPMWGLQLPGALSMVAPLLARAGTAIGLGKMALAGQPKGFYLTRAPFENNNLTHDENTWAYMRNQILRYPELALGAPSFRWLKSAFDEFKHFRSAPMPATPVLTLLGGQESIVSAPAIQALNRRFKNGTLFELEGARHEVWMETEERQQRAWQATDGFLSGVLPA